MPIYEYQCAMCGNDSELLIMGTSKAVCPSCGSNDLKRKFSVFGMRSQSGFRSSSGSCCGGCNSGSCKGCNH